ncbi:Putative HAD-hydrolase YfnB [bacterium HR17]|uniref:HAD-hydrolase YfnB n=1 Tax=Candidatus Fervidibacter japonicus TaxID=2035412 RepID=A0A2H5XA26_9BACT|nr:Putative HAD-hydrolase YfnB [bacterium HR17]
MPAIRLVLLDAGGTLTVGVPPREERLRRACEHFGLAPVPDFATAREGLRAVERFFIAAAQEGQMLDRETVREAVQTMLRAMGVFGKLDDPALLWDFVETQYETETLMDGAVETLTVLRRQGYRLAIASNAPPTYTQRLNALGLTDLVDAIFLSDVVGYAKPDPRFFRFILEQMEVVPDETVHVGNSFWHDVIGAQRAGIVPVFFDWREVLPDCPCPRITALAQLPSLLVTLAP